MDLDNIIAVILRCFPRGTAWVDMQSGEVKVETWLAWWPKSCADKIRKVLPMHHVSWNGAFLRLNTGMKLSDISSD